MNMEYKTISSCEKINRDNKGRFVKGNDVATQRDPTTGRFTSNLITSCDKVKPTDRYTTVSQEVDNFLKECKVNRIV